MSGTHCSGMQCGVSVSLWRSVLVGQNGTLTQPLYVMCYIYCSVKVSFGRFTVEEDALGKMWRKNMFPDIHACD